MGTQIRVRFAPSPTGEPHLGTLRTAIFNWLFARNTGGKFIIRIEDTDQSRKVENASDHMIQAMEWLGVDWDDGPYYQSERLELYTEVINQLIHSENAYRCYCSPEKLTKIREKQQQLKQIHGYNRHCRNLSNIEKENYESNGAKSVVRFAMPLEGTTEFTDLVKSKVSFENNLIDDCVILKSDKFPTYHLANVVDDHSMNITHVLRAEEWLSSTPRHIQIYKALNWTIPKFAHLPMILAADKSKLSKRHGATSVLEYRRQGYLPEAMFNFLTLLGWSLDDKTDIISIPDITKHFTIERISKSAAIFNSDKLDWLNGIYIRQLKPDDLAEILLEYWRNNPVKDIPNSLEKSYITKIIPLIQKRLKTLDDASPLISFFFKDEVEYIPSDLIQKDMTLKKTKHALQEILNILKPMKTFNATTIEQNLRNLVAQLGIKSGQLFGTLRVATTGLSVAPPLFETMEILGHTRTIDSVKNAIKKLS